MYKIAILGSENSHALHFAQLMNGGHPMRNGRGYSDFEVIGAYGYDENANKELLEKGGVGYIADHYSDFVGKVDAVMITARHGDDHYKFAQPYLEAGIPMFVDKPITINEEEAIALAKTAKEKGIPLCGGSVVQLVTSTQYLKKLVKNPEDFFGKVIGGTISAPVYLKNAYGDFYFYAQHLIQTSLEIFGYDLQSIFAFGRENTVTTIGRYDQYDVTSHFGVGSYSATIYGQKKNAYREIDSYTDGYLREVELFMDMVKTGQMFQSYSDFIKPVFVMNAIDQSMKTGNEVKIRNVDI